MRGDRLRELRTQKNLTHEELAERLSIGVAQIWRYENEKTDPNTKMLTKFAQFFDVSTDYLLGLTDDPKSNLKIDNLTTKERQILAAMRRGEVVEAIRAIVTNAS